MSAPTEGILGATRREGKRLMDLWWQEMTEAAQTGRPTAYVFAMGSMAELLRTFDFVLNFPEITSLQIAVRGQSQAYIQAAEDYGFSPDVCGYVKADVGLQLRQGEHPYGRVPRPSLVVTSNVCNTYIKWSEIWEHLYGCPVFVVDLPGWRGRESAALDGETFRNDARYVQGQLQELIGLCEQITGRRFDVDRFREHLAEANRMAELYNAVCETNRHIPAPFNAVVEGVTYQGIAHLYRGSQEGSRYFQQVLQEMQERIRLGMAAVPDERFRLVLVGTTCYSHFRRFVELFASWGGVFVHSTYMVFAGGGFLPGFAYDLSRPLESFAERMVAAAYWGYTGSMFYQQDWLDEVVRRWHVDGICFHGVKSCRTVSTGLPDVREWMRIQRNVPGLFIQSDLVDPRLWSDAQVKNRVDAFFEALAAHKAATRR
ncbi:MAG: 2-hydroxyacyl-CoA dehydratase family protein [Armatimonadetes bacterium]|nr:2-hydroxyacyl-CoA dehydratase family protein [Armatimonadota bacterium]MDW8153657.1 2-hydroxyacyl-CoA dehydratase family protein [Armatimonadota bacterium]